MNSIAAMTMYDAWHPDGRGPKFEIRCAGLDHWAAIRNLHAFSFGHLTGPSIDTGQGAAFVARIREPEYTLALETQDLLVACIDHQLIGTAGWEPVDGDGLVAHVASVYVSPLFTRLGIGRQLVEASEARAWLAGYRDFAVRAFPSSVGFFESLGYARSSERVHAADSADDLPAVFMRKVRSLEAEAGGARQRR